MKPSTLVLAFVSFNQLSALAAHGDGYFFPQEKRDANSFLRIGRLKVAKLEESVSNWTGAKLQYFVTFSLSYFSFPLLIIFVGSLRILYSTDVCSEGFHRLPTSLHMVWEAQARFQRAVASLDIHHREAQSSFPREFPPINLRIPISFLYKQISQHQRN